MTNNKVLGISLAMLMLAGSVPMGFSEPLNVQIAQGMEPDMEDFIKKQVLNDQKNMLGIPDARVMAENYCWDSLHLQHTLLIERMCLSVFSVFI